MRIGIDYTAGIRQGAGVGRFVRNLVSSLLALDRENKYTLMYARTERKSPAPRLPTGPNVSTRPLLLTEKMANLLWYKLGVAVPIELLGPIADLYYFPDFALPPVRRGRSVITVHDLSFLLVPDCAEIGLRKHLEKIVPMSVRYADFVTADSENTRNELTTLLDVEPNRVDVVYGGVDAHFHRIVDEAEIQAARAKYGLYAPFILYVGTIEPRKNLGRLLRAYTGMRTKYRSKHRLVIVGGLGWLYQDVLREIEEISSEHEVVFLGRVSDEDLPALYSLADIFVFPSLYEGFGLPPLEAMACGLPVVCSSASSLPEVVGEAGVLVSPYDVDAWSSAMADLLEDGDRRRELGRRGEER
ncbi:MAG TPA: glycosyltransferase family 1 protein, partial [Chloroflexota bacterium]|nr:glycosyltransferase family 1 protein [Chloroflexota bacterium]